MVGGRDDALPSKPIRVLAVASGGGHWVQLLRLRPAWAGCDVAYATVHASSASEVPGARFFTFKDVSRRNKAGFAVAACQMLGIVARVRPDVVVTTGSAPALLALLFGRAFGARTLWIDSIANSERLSSSGRRACKLANQCVTQWPELSGPSGPAYWGSVL